MESSFDVEAGCLAETRCWAMGSKRLVAAMFLVGDVFVVLGTYVSSIDVSRDGCFVANI